MWKLFYSGSSATRLRRARRYLADTGGVLLDFGYVNGNYAYSVSDYDTAIEEREHLGGARYLDSLLDYDETRLRRSNYNEN